MCRLLEVESISAKQGKRKRKNLFAIEGGGKMTPSSFYFLKDRDNDRFLGSCSSSMCAVYRELLPHSHRV